MCLYTKSKTSKIAAKDIVCYKVVTKENRAPYFKDFMYVKDVTYSQYVQPRRVSYDHNDPYQYEINEGLHSFTSWLRARVEVFFGRFSPVHSPKDIKIVKCLIPDGSEYWIGQRGEQVSNKLTFGV